jgi:site-specific recombinase XerD
MVGTFGKTIMKDPKGFLSIDQIKRLLGVALKNNTRDYILLLTMFKTGRRVSEVLILKKGDIDFENKRIVFSVLKRRNPIKRWFEVDKEVIVALKKYCEVYRIIEADDILFPITRQRVFQLFRKYCKEIGLDWVGEKKPHPHHLRHCVVATTRICTSNGLLTAKELYEQDINKVYSYDFKNKKIVLSNVIAKNKHRTPILKIITNNKLALSCSSKHILFIQKGSKIKEINAGKLCINDKIATIPDIKKGLKWFKIKSITEKPEEETYDFTIQHKNLITDGILSHNSFAIQFIQAGNTKIEDLKVLQEYLGHASIDSTSCYLQFDKDLYRKKLERIPNVILDTPSKSADKNIDSDTKDKKADKPDPKDT